MAALLMPVIIGFLALALEIARIYNRKVEMQSLASAIAISAARQLNGAQDGVNAALAAAHDVVEGGYALTTPRYEYGKSMAFSDGAIKFSKSADGAAGWLNADGAKASPTGISYVKVDTRELSANYGVVDLFFIRVVSALQSVNVSHVAVAGRHRLNVLPFAICAMSKDPANPIKERPNPDSHSELTEYGFRRGVSYNLMRLSPNSSTPVNYMIDPINLPPKTGSSTADIVGPHVCTGTVELPQVVNKAVNLLPNLTIDMFVNQLNSRFDLSNGQCSAVAAPPDTNVRQYPFGGINWMTKPLVQVADPASTPNRMETIADLDPPNNQVPTRYGPLWVFSMAVPWTAYTAGQNEPTQGYTPFPATTAIWNSLYSTGPGLGTYPKDAKTGVQSPPYFTQTTAPAANPPGVMYRRVLNVPLLSCPSAGAPGTVVAIGKFFMTVPANINGIYAEFAGSTGKEQIAGPVEVYQ
jgi:hypothetical protein